MPTPSVPDMSRSPTGRQWSIGHGRQSAVVTEVGATLRTYDLAGRSVIDGFGGAELSPSGRGQVLAPWPNRLGDGRYEFNGVGAQAPINEPELGNAIHGLVRWLPWRVEAQAQNVVSLTCPLYPSPAYPFSLALGIEYRLGRAGLSVTTSAANAGDAPLPFALGFHPYLTAGTERVDTSVLQLPARQRLVLDERSLPTGEQRSVTGGEFDFTQARAVGSTRLDTAFTTLERGPDGLARATLTDPSGSRGAELWMDDRFPHLMVFTGDTLGDPGRRRRALAIEPMTAPPDALRTGRDLVVLEPGEEWVAAWGVTPG